MKITYEIALIGAATALMSLAAISTPAHASQVRLNQQIKPIECVYTMTQTGVTMTVSDTCDDLPVPIIDTLNVNGGRPIIMGSYSTSRTALLRVWLYGQWYTSGVDSQLTTDDDTWVLDLSEMTPLPTGTYDVILRVKATDGLVIQNSDAASFSLVQTEPSVIVPVAPKSLGSSQTLGVTTTILGINEPGSPFVVPPLTSLSTTTVSPVSGRHISSAVALHWLFWAIIAVLGAVVARIIIKSRRHDT